MDLAGLAMASQRCLHANKIDFGSWSLIGQTPYARWVPSPLGPLDGSSSSEL